MRLFAAFPAVYATVFSGFYLAPMLLLVALIALRGGHRVPLQAPLARMRSFWDWAFSLGSILPAVLLGVAFGNILHGLPLDEQGNYTGTFFDLLNPFSLLIGVLALAACTFHGAIYLAAKTAPAPAASSSTAAPPPTRTRWRFTIAWHPRPACFLSSSRCSGFCPL